MHTVAKKFITNRVSSRETSDWIELLQRILSAIDTGYVHIQWHTRSSLISHFFDIFQRRLSVACIFNCFRHWKSPKTGPEVGAYRPIPSTASQLRSRTPRLRLSLKLTHYSTPIFYYTVGILMSWRCCIVSIERFATRCRLGRSVRFSRLTPPYVTVAFCWFFVQVEKVRFSIWTDWPRPENWDTRIEIDQSTVKDIKIPTVQGKFPCYRILSLEKNFCGKWYTEICTTDGATQSPQSSATDVNLPHLSTGYRKNFRSKISDMQNFVRNARSF